MSEQTSGTRSSTLWATNKERTGGGGPTLDWVLLPGLFEAGFSSLSLFLLSLTLYLLSLSLSSLILATDDDMKNISKILAKNRSFLQLGTVNLHNENTFHLMASFILFTYLLLRSVGLVVAIKAYTCTSAHSAVG